MKMHVHDTVKKISSKTPIIEPPIVKPMIPPNTAENIIISIIENTIVKKKGNDEYNCLT